MTEAIPLLPLYAFMALKGIILPLQQSTNEDLIKSATKCRISKKYSKLPYLSYI
jgi:hypothetical protein